VTDPSLTITDASQSLTTATEIALDGQSPSTLVSQFARSPAFLDTLTAAARDAIADLPPDQSHDALPNVLHAGGVTALDGMFAHLLADQVRARNRYDADSLLFQQTLATIGNNEIGPLGFHEPLDAWDDGPIALLAAADRRPAVTVVVESGFRTQRRDQRETICALLTSLARVADVTLVASTLTQRWLYHTHRTDLPSVSDHCSTGRQTPPRDEVVAHAADHLSPDGRPVRVLELLHDTDTGTLSYTALESEFTVSRSRIRQVVGDLVDLHLVETFETGSGHAVDLLAAGRQLVTEEIAIQRRLDDCVSESGHSESDSRVTTREHGREDSGGGLVTVARYSTAAHHAAAASAPLHGIGLVDHDLDQWDRPNDRWPRPHLNFDPERSELVVGAEWVNPLQWWVSVARALTEPVVLEDILTDARLETAIGEVLDDYREVLHDCRCLGWLDEEVTEPADYREALGDAHDDLLELTRDLGAGSYADRDEFRGEILRTAHGLVGTMLHLLEMADIDVVREIRVPQGYSGLGSDGRRDLLRSLATGLSVGASKAGHTHYRQVFEQRSQKREQALGVEVDPADPAAEMIGGVTIVGRGVEALEGDLERLDEFVEVHEEAPELPLHLPIRTADRSVYGEVVTRSCTAKGLSATREAVSTLRGVTGSPYSVAAAIGRGLARESKAGKRGREIRPEEVRIALGSLDAERILPELPRSVGSIVQVLVRRRGRVSRSEIVAAAGISQRTFRRHQDKLAGLGIVEETESGWRFTVDDDGYPRVVREPMVRHDAVWEFVESVIDDATRLSDPTDPIVSDLHDGPPFEREVVTSWWEWAGPWWEVLDRLVDHEWQLREHGLSEGRDGGETSGVVMGPRPSQATLTGGFGVGGGGEWAPMSG
jgi:DNA-binding transcriptional ArsR family regulator